MKTTNIQSIGLGALLMFLLMLGLGLDMPWLQRAVSNPASTPNKATQIAPTAPLQAPTSASNFPKGLTYR